MKPYTLDHFKRVLHADLLEGDYTREMREHLAGLMGVVGPYCLRCGRPSFAVLGVTRLGCCSSDATFGEYEAMPLEALGVLHVAGSLDIKRQQFMTGRNKKLDTVTTTTAAVHLCRRCSSEP